MEFCDSRSVGLAVGKATSPGDRLIGCVSNPDHGQKTSSTHAVLASSAQPSPHLTPDRNPGVTIDDDDKPSACGSAST